MWDVPWQGLKRLRKKSQNAWEQPPGLKPGNLFAECFRGLKSPLPGTEVRGWHQRIGSDRAVASLKGLAVVRSAGLMLGAAR